MTARAACFDKFEFFPMTAPNSVRSIFFDKSGRPEDISNQTLVLLDLR